MVPLPDDPHPQNEETYDQLISLIENSQGRLAPIIVACDDSHLRQQIVMRYEAETRQAKIRPYRIVLGQEPSLRAGLVALKQQETQLQQGGTAVFTVTGAELLLRVKLNPQDEQSELDKFFGYLQWTREGLREFPYSIVLWVTERIFLEMRRRAPDFWSWRKATLRFADESPQAPSISIATNQLQPTPNNSEAEFLPPLPELQAEIAELTAKDPDSPGLAPLYDRLGQVYAQRISQGVAQNLEQEREQAIAAFQQAITRYHGQNNPAAEMWTLIHLGSFFESQSRYPEAIACDEKSLEIARAIADRYSEAASLGNLGIAYHFLGQYQRAIDVQQQSLKIKREIGDRQGEANSLGNLGIGYHSLGQYQRAIDLEQQSLEIKREIGDLQGEANYLHSLGNAYHDLGQYQRAIDFYHLSLEIFHEVGNRHYEANALFTMARSLAKLGQSWEAKQHYQQAKQLYQLLGLEHNVEKCNTAIYGLNQIIPAQQSIRAPKVRDESPPVPRPFSRKRRQTILLSGFLVGLAVVLLVWWLMR